MTHHGLGGDWLQVLYVDVVKYCDSDLWEFLPVGGLLELIIVFSCSCFNEVVVRDIFNAVVISMMYSLQCNSYNLMFCDVIKRTGNRGVVCHKHGVYMKSMNR